MQLQLGLVGAIFGRIAQTLFGQNHAAFRLERPIAHQELAACFPQQHQGDVQALALRLGHIQHVDGLGLGGEGVGVRTKGQTLAFQDLDHVAIGNVGRTLEGHVFEKVGQALLRVRLLQRPRPYPQA